MTTNFVSPMVVFVIPPKQKKLNGGMDQSFSLFNSLPDLSSNGKIFLIVVDNNDLGTGKFTFLKHRILLNVAKTGRKLTKTMYGNHVILFLDKDNLNGTNDIDSLIPADLRELYSNHGAFGFYLFLYCEDQYDKKYSKYAEKVIFGAENLNAVVNYHEKRHHDGKKTNDTQTLLWWKALADYFKNSWKNFVDAEQIE